MNSFLNLRIVGINHLKLNTASLSTIPLRLIRIAEPSHISASSSLVFTSGCLLSAERIMKLSPSDFAMIKNSPFLSLAIRGDLISLSLFTSSLKSFAFIFSAFAELIISISLVLLPGSRTDKLSACSFDIGIP